METVQAECLELNKNNNGVFKTRSEGECNV